jgi:hypothetical protein
MKNIFYSICLLTIAFVSCKKESNDGVATSSVMLNGANVVPAVTSTGTAKFSYSYNANTNNFTYQIDYSGLTDSCTQFGVSFALPGQPLPSSTFQLFNFSSPISLQRRTAGTYTGNFIVDGQQMTLADLKAGKYCVYLKSKAYTTNGELRAQILLP